MGLNSLCRFQEYDPSSRGSSEIRAICAEPQHPAAQLRSELKELESEAKEIMDRVVAGDPIYHSA